VITGSKGKLYTNKYSVSIEVWIRRQDVVAWTPTQVIWVLVLGLRSIEPCWANRLIYNSLPE